MQSGLKDTELMYLNIPKVDKKSDFQKKNRPQNGAPSKNIYIFNITTNLRLQECSEKSFA